MCKAAGAWHVGLRSARRDRAANPPRHPANYTATYLVVLSTKPGVAVDRSPSHAAPDTSSTIFPKCSRRSISQRFVDILNGKAMRDHRLKMLSGDELQRRHEVVVAAHCRPDQADLTPVECAAVERALAAGMGAEVDKHARPCAPSAGLPEWSRRLPRRRPSRRPGPLLPPVLAP